MRDPEWIVQIAGAWAAGAVIRAAAGDPVVADVDPVTDPADGGHPVGDDAGGRECQGVVGGIHHDHG